MDHQSGPFSRLNISFCWEKNPNSTIVVVQSLSRVRLLVTPWIAAHQASLSITPRVGSNSCPLSQWCHPAISFSVTPFSSCLQSFPASGSFPMSQFFASGDQSIGASASASVLPVNIQSWFTWGFTGLTFCCPRDSQEFSPAPQCESITFSVFSLHYGLTLTSLCDYYKNHGFVYMDFCWQSNVSAF